MVHGRYLQNRKKNIRATVYSLLHSCWGSEKNGAPHVHSNVTENPTTIKNTSKANSKQQNCGYPMFS